MEGSGGSPRLPELRPELELLKGAPQITGEPTWLIRDPLQNRFIQIDRATYDILSVWSECTTREELLARVEQEGKVILDAAGLDHLLAFLAGNHLLDQRESGVWHAVHQKASAKKHTPLAWLAHNYLFFRLPLVQPQEFLTRTLPWVSPLAGRRSIACFMVLGLAGLYLASRSWDEFVLSAAAVFSWEGVIASIVALMFVKAAHELGHAYAAVAYGCRVPTMGVAFILLTPLLYTDVTDSWRLTERRQRLLIGAAGILVELAIAAVALAAWAFLPNGPVRHAAFILAVVSLLSSIAINLNPLMRFDGYYLLADFLGIENMQDRSFELARWKMREALFGLGVPCPEHLPDGHRRLLIVLGWATWLYRFMLFLGIAFIVYQFFFKALGLILFAIEIGYFILRPLWGEVKAWIALGRPALATRRTAVTVGLALTALVLAALPWSTRIAVPAVLEPAELAQLHPVRPARIGEVHVRQGEAVAAGAPILTLSSPEIEHALETVRIRLRLARLQHARRVADAADREVSLELEQTIAALLTRIEGLEREKAELIMRAPFAGRVVELNPHLAPGVWIGPRDLVAVVANETRWVARGYVAEADVWRIARGDAGAFVPEAPQRPRARIVVRDISPGGSGQIEIADLASLYGGGIGVVQDERRRLVPTIAHYPIALDVALSDRAPELATRGTAVIAGKPESLLAALWRKTVIVVLRESGF